MTLKSGAKAAKARFVFPPTFSTLVPTGAPLGPSSHVSEAERGQEDVSEPGVG